MFDPGDDECSGWLTPAGQRALDEAERRAEGRAARAVFRAWLAPLRTDEDLRRGRMLIQTNTVDRLAQRKSFSEAAAQTIYGHRSSIVPDAWWRTRRGHWFHGPNLDAGYPENVDVYMTNISRPDVAGVLKSDLVWAHCKALQGDHREACDHDRGACNVIGPPSPLPG